MAVISPAGEAAPPIPQKAAPPRAPVTLHGGPLWAARAATVAVLAAGLWQLLAGSVVMYGQLGRVCRAAECFSWQLTGPEAQAMQALGLSLSVYALYVTLLTLVLGLGYCTVALVIFGLRSREWLALAVSIWLVTFGVNIFAPGEALALVWPAWLWPASMLDLIGWAILLTFFLFTFPDGRFVPRWTRWLYLAWLAAGAVNGVLRPESLLLNSPTPGGEQVYWFAVQLAGVASQVYRYLKVSSPVERQQTKWVVYGLLLLVAGLVTLVVLQAVTLAPGQPGLDELVREVLGIAGVALAFALVPFALLFSILRYRLWDIDLIIRRTLLYGGLTAVLGAGYLGSVVALQGLLRSLVGQSSAISIVISTLALAALFNPLRRRLQEWIDRRFYRRKYDAAQTLAEFSAWARDETDLESLSQQLIAVVNETMQPSAVTLWLKPTAQQPEAARRERGR